MAMRVIGAAALLAMTAACGGETAETAAPANEAAAPAGGMTDAQNRVRALEPGQRDAVLIRAIRDADLTCQHVQSSEEQPGAADALTYLARCDDGGAYAVSITQDGTAMVRPMTAVQGQ